MVPSAATPNKKLKVFLQQAVPLFQNCKAALANRDWATLRKKSKDLQKVAGSTAQVMIEVQAQLLEQAAAQGQVHRASYLLLRIKNGLAMVLAEVKGRGGFAEPASEQEPAASPLPVSSSDVGSKLLGQYLVEAQLLTPAQIDVALADQKSTGARLGEILSTRGWIKQGTIEFLMQKVVIPERQTPPAPEPEPAPQPNPTQDISSRATWVDGNKSTYIY
jgi:HPt (histidine-containing phosphotransfer) domain-containing protein